MRYDVLASVRVTEVGCGATPAAAGARPGRSVPAGRAVPGRGGAGGLGAAEAPVAHEGEGAAVDGGLLDEVAAEGLHHAGLARERGVQAGAGGDRGRVGDRPEQLPVDVDVVELG